MIDQLCTRFAKKEKKVLEEEEDTDSLEDKE
jgi:hypothetical protein